jgi:hypothetical protein
MGVATFAQAGIVVDVNLPAAKVDLNRTADTDTGTTRAWNFNTSTPFFNGPTNSGLKIYGGLTATSAAALGADGSYIGVSGAQQGVRIQVSSGSSLAVAEKCLLLWDKADFLTSDNKFDTSVDSSLNLTIDVLTSSAGYEKGLRYVIREGSTYYVSETGVNAAGSSTLTGATAKWGRFTASDFSLFQNSAADAGMGVSSYAPMTFNDVTGVGVIFNIERAAAQGPIIRISDYQVALIPEPGTLGIITAAGIGVLFIRRRLGM